jgi:hypothetical protein
MKRLLFAIAVSVIISSCYMTKKGNVQVKSITVTLIDKKTAHNNWRGQQYECVWTDGDALFLTEYCPCPQLKIGDTKQYLITR